MRRKFFAVVGLVIIISSLVFSTQAFAWAIKGGSVICFDGIWKGSINLNAQTTCEIQPQGNATSFSMLVWCANSSNNVDNFSPPKVIEFTGDMEGSSSNLNGSRTKGKVSPPPITINSEALVNSAVCAQGQSNPNQSGQWRVAKALPSGPFTAYIWTYESNSIKLKEEVLDCTGTVNNGNSLSSYVDQITDILRTGSRDLSSLNLVYDCTTVSSN
jgi:hypothetical protein